MKKIIKIDIQSTLFILDIVANRSKDLPIYLLTSIDHDEIRELIYELKDWLKQKNLDLINQSFRIEENDDNRNKIYCLKMVAVHDFGWKVHAYVGGYDPITVGEGGEDHLDLFDENGKITKETFDEIHKYTKNVVLNSGFYVNDLTYFAISPAAILSDDIKHKGEG